MTVVQWGSETPLPNFAQSTDTTLPSYDELVAECESLRWHLWKAKENGNWWWQEAQRLGQEAKHWTGVQVSSPLTGQEHWIPKPSSEGWAWRHFPAHCPCCKRPLGVTVHRYSNDAARDAQAENQDAQINDGTLLRYMDEPWVRKEMPIFRSPKSFDVVGSVPRNGTVAASGQVEVVDGYRMVPVYPGGAVDVRYFEVVDAGSLPAPEVSPEPQEGGGDAGAQLAPAREREMEALKASPTEAPASGRWAYCCVLWGANAGYALGAAVLGRRLRELEAESCGQGSPELVLLHTDDVPANFLAALGKVWTLQQIEYIDGVEALYSHKGTVFDGVFTKLAAWGLEEYDKVLLLDIDVIPLRCPRGLFELEPPAALVRGNSEPPHGSAVEGERFFLGEANGDSSWWQGGGINAGVILLRPCRRTLARMVLEVTSEFHPEHLPGHGPEQDYLTRFFASAPWHALDVRWNYQIHHVPFAMELVLEWRGHHLRAGGELSEQDRAWRPRRLRTKLEDIGIVHFSGDVKLWHVHLDAAQETGQRRAVEHVPSAWTDDGLFGEHLLRSSCEGYARWFERSAAPEDYERFSCARGEGGRLELLAGAGRAEDVTALVEEAVAGLRELATAATAAWRGCAERLLAAELPGLLEELQRPAVPEGSLPPGARVQVLWQGPKVPQAVENEEAAGCGRWLPAKVVSVHVDGRHVVRYDHGGTWGDTERGVPRSRLRLEEEEAPAERC